MEKLTITKVQSQTFEKVQIGYNTTNFFSQDKEK